MKKVLVTGGSRGIGLSICEDLTAAGFSVTALSSKDVDLSDIKSVEAFIAKNKAHQFDVLVNNAGENIVKPFSEIDLNTWNKIQNINLNSVFLLTQHFGNKMSANGYGRIVNIASIFSFLTREGRGAYATAKSGVLGLTRTAAVEWAKANVLVNAVSPGYVDTELTRKNNSAEKIAQICETIPIHRMAKPAEIAKLVRFLTSPENTYITGQNIVIDGGFSLL